MMAGRLEMQQRRQSLSARLIFGQPWVTGIVEKLHVSEIIEAPAAPFVCRDRLLAASTHVYVFHQETL